jgi:hypothetical protein
MLGPEAPPVQIASASTPDPVHTDAKEAVSSAETLDESLPDSSQVLGPETPPVQIATVSTPDLVDGDAKEAVTSAATLDESLPEPSQALTPETPIDAKEAVSSTETLDECLVRETCIDHYLWSVYQRTPKQDTVKVVERRKVTVKMNGKPRTVIKEFKNARRCGLHLEGSEDGRESQHVIDGIRNRRHGSGLQAEAISCSSRNGRRGALAGHNKRIP